jgi:hypothetical protein
MKTAKKLIYLSLLAAWCAGPAVSLAGKCAGTNINTMLSWEPNEISKGTTLTTFRHTSVIVSDDVSAPYHLLAGECIGAFLGTPDGKMQGSGSCARKDKDGDVLNEEFVMPAGTDFKGTWKLVGGTGKFANAAGTAQWQVIMSQGKMGAVRWVGNCQ